MLAEEGMVDQLLDMGAVVRVLAETLVKKVPHLHTHEQVGRNLDLVFNDFDEFFLTSDLKRVLTHHHLVHHDPYRPNIDFLVILTALQDLRADIEWGTTEGGPELIVLVHRPPKVTQLYYILHPLMLTSCNTMFSGLISL